MPNGGTIGYVDQGEQARIEKSLRDRLAKPKYPAIFYLPQAFEVHSPETVVAPHTGTARCPSVARSERGIGGSRARGGAEQCVIRSVAPCPQVMEDPTRGCRFQLRCPRCTRTGSGANRRRLGRGDQVSQKMQP